MEISGLAMTSTPLHDVGFGEKDVLKNKGQYLIKK